MDKLIKNLYGRILSRPKKFVRSRFCCFECRPAEVRRKAPGLGGRRTGVPGQRSATHRLGRRQRAAGRRRQHPPNKNGKNGCAQTFLVGTEFSHIIYISIYWRTAIWTGEFHWCASFQWPELFEWYAVYICGAVLYYGRFKSVAHW